MYEKQIFWFIKSTSIKLNLYNVVLVFWDKMVLEKQQLLTCYPVSFKLILEAYIVKLLMQLQFLHFLDEGFKDNYTKIRPKLGLCSQKDFLFENMTIEEHLRMIAIIREVQSYQITEEIENTIMKVGLDKERGKFAINLSGGSKRKLSLGMAIIGNVQFIFLDEPTSGKISLK